MDNFETILIDKVRSKGSFWSNVLDRAVDESVLRMAVIVSGKNNVAAQVHVAARRRQDSGVFKTRKLTDGRVAVWFEKKVEK